MDVEYDLIKKREKKQMCALLKRDLDTLLIKYLLMAPWLGSSPGQGYCCVPGQDT